MANHQELKSNQIALILKGLNDLASEHLWDYILQIDLTHPVDSSQTVVWKSLSSSDDEGTMFFCIKSIPVERCHTVHLYKDIGCTNSLWYLERWPKQTGNVLLNDFYVIIM